MQKICLLTSLNDGLNSLVQVVVNSLALDSAEVGLCLGGTKIGPGVLELCSLGFEGSPGPRSVLTVDLLVLSLRCA